MRLGGAGTPYGAANMSTGSEVKTASPFLPKKRRLDGTYIHCLLIQAHTYDDYELRTSELLTNELYTTL